MSVMTSEPDKSNAVETAVRAIKDYEVLGSTDWRRRDDVRACRRRTARILSFGSWSRCIAIAGNCVTGQTRVRTGRGRGTISAG